MDKSLTLQSWVHTLEQTLADKFDTPILKHSVFHVLARVFGGASFELYQYLDVLAEQAMIDTAMGEYLTRWASVWGIYRKEAQFAQGQVSLQGEDALIAKGTQLKRAGGTLFKITENINTALTRTAPIKAIEAGSAANTLPDVHLQLVSPIVGTSSQTTVIAPGISGGQEAGSDDQLRQRLLDRIQHPILGGRAQDYIQWAKEVPGVKDAWVSPCHFGAGTVAVTYLCDNEMAPIPDDAHIKLVQSHLESRRPLSAEVFVIAPQLVPINLNLKVEQNQTEVRHIITMQLAAAFEQQAYPGIKLGLNFYHRVLSHIPSLNDYQIVTPTDTQTFQFQQLPTLGQITWQLIP